jgi:hypothetical protein
MTRNAIHAGVSRVIESRTKAAQAGKSFHRTRLRVRVTDRADRARRVVELESVAARTRQMIDLPGKANASRIVIPAMADKTRQPRVVLIAVSELRIVGLLFGVCWDRFPGVRIIRRGGRVRNRYLIRYSASIRRGNVLRRDRHGRQRESEIRKTP